MCTKILVECPQKIASVRVGVLGPLNPLSEASVCSVRYRDSKDVEKDDILWCDILVCVRGCEYVTLQIVQAAVKAGRFVVYFLDDDLLHVPSINPTADEYNRQTVQKYLIPILSQCHVLWGVNQKLLAYYRQWCPRSILLRVPAKVERPPQTVIDKIHVLYAGSTDHSSMAKNILAPAVKKILVEYSDRVDFTFIGANPRLENTPGVTFMPFLDDYNKYRRLVYSANYHVGLAPAVDTPFFACKYYNKFIEYTSCGIMGVYSDLPPYTMIVKNKKNGILCGSGPDAWYEALKFILNNPEIISEFTENAQTTLEQDFSYSSITQSLSAALPELYSYRAPPYSRNQICLPSARWIFYKERLLLVFRSYGILSAFVILFKITKKLIAKLKKGKGHD